MAMDGSRRHMRRDNARRARDPSRGPGAIGFGERVTRSRSGSGFGRGFATQRLVASGLRLRSGSGGADSYVRMVNNGRIVAARRPASRPVIAGRK
jgi:hypothetical protein